jgi:hypothetical protein
MLSVNRASKITRSRQPKLFGLITPKRKILPMISPSQLRNYALQDTLVDYFHLYNTKSKFGSHTFDSLTSFIIEQGTKFEEALVKHINNNIHPVVKVTEYTITDETIKRTKDLMKSGVPIIHGAPVRNHYNNTQGIIDLLVRSDYVHLLVKECPLTEDEQSIPAPKLGGEFHYVVIDIKFSTLPLRADGIHLLNSDKYKFYKMQLSIYNKAVSHIQGYLPPCAYIMGRRWKYTQKGIIYNSLSCLDRLGVINYDQVDKEYVNKTQEAIKWKRKLLQDGYKMEVSPPSCPELYPNMCQDSGLYNTIKKDIALQNGEISLLWYCGPKNRELALKCGVSSFFDKKCCSKILGIGEKRGYVVDKMIKINTQNVDMIRPKKINSNILNWKKNTNEMFVDFETLLDVCFDPSELPIQKNTDIIFMIGVGHTVNNKFTYTNFVCNSPTIEEEYNIMNQFVEFLRAKRCPKLWYWFAENNMWTRAENRQHTFWELDIEKQKNILTWKDRINWYDLSELFKQTPIVIKGCFGFGLKDIAENMRKYKLIDIKIESECDSGKAAMVQAMHAYTNTSNPASSSIMNDIAVYNRFDVEVLNDILKYLRINHS